MSTAATRQISSASSAETEELAARLGRQLKGGEIIELVSDLGGGKTTLVRGLVKGAGSPDKVASPSFTLGREYRTSDLTIYHFDFYRLQEPGIMQLELQEALDNKNGVVVIEWADIVKGVLPPERITIQIKTTGENSREFTLSYPEALQYMVDKLD